MKDELIIKLERLLLFYVNRYNKKGVKRDRLRKRILIKYINEMSTHLKE